MEATVKISIRNLVESVMKTGSIDSGNSFASMNQALEGGKGHRAVQKQRADENEQYLAEVPVSICVAGAAVTLEIGGRIDGVIINDGTYIIEEIKTTERQLELMNGEENSLHWAQAICYAYIYSNQNSLPCIGVQLTYYNRSTKEVRSFHRQYEYHGLEEFFLDLAARYMKWAEIANSWNNERRMSISELGFPFEKYRAGQRDFAVAVYKSITSGKRLFAKAPTGIGKTMAAIFPAVKAIGEGHVSRLFYLTAKTSTRQIAEEAFEKLRRNGLHFRTVTITAKEKICPQDKVSCKPEDCPFAEGYFDRIDAALEDILKHQNFNRDMVLEHANRHSVCPFEFSLDLSLFCDGIICDYNYVFDPRVYLKRFFTDVKEDYGFLVDEAHNLVDRAREMYSAGLSKSEFLSLKKEMKDFFEMEKKGAAAELKKSLNNINSFFINQRKELEQNGQTSNASTQRPEELDKYLDQFLLAADKILSRGQKFGFKDTLLDLYFLSMNYLRTADSYDDKYMTYLERDGQDVRLKLFCLDPSHLLNMAMKRGRSTVLFSATFSPLDYFRSILGGSDEDYKISIRSPFASEKLCLLAANNINTTYRVREQSYRMVAEYIHVVVSAKKGNYFVFFPSYKYLKEVYEVFAQEYPDIVALVQRGDMSEEEREDFLNHFEDASGNGVVGFAVLGGAFGEGIDLTGDKLIGAVIVGVGLPQLCLERDIIKEHFASENGMGFEYAYSYPGMNKVLQAAGRVIRTESDKGVVFLIDERFSRNDYRSLMPPEWKHIRWVKNSSMIKEELDEFWRIV